MNSPEALGRPTTQQRVSDTAARVTALEARVGRLESEREALSNLALDWDRDLDRLVDGEELA